MRERVNTKRRPGEGGGSKSSRSQKVTAIKCKKDFDFTDGPDCF